MEKVRWKLITIAVVFLLFAVNGVYPILANRFGLPVPAWLARQQLKLGLDLQGGVHLVLQVHTDDALRVETELQVERMREALTTANVTVGNVNVTSPVTFVVEGVTPDQEQAFRQQATESEVNFDRSSTPGGNYTFTMRSSVQITLREESVVQARETIVRRIDELGVAEPIVARQGASGDQILVQLPGVTDVQRAKEIIQSTGLLELKLVDQGPAVARETLMRNGVVPAGAEILPGVSNIPGEGVVYYLVRQAAAVSGRDLRTARPSLDDVGRPAVSFTLNSDGARRFGRVTEQNIGKLLGIILDGRVQSVATIESRISSDGVIRGSFTQDEVNNLALILRSGALPATLTYLEESFIGPTLGADSIRSGVTASLVGLTLVVVFMLAFYRLSGVNAIVALVFNLVILLGLMAYVGQVMTLPGIAGFILTIGIGVDSNVLIFERIKEELALQRGVRPAINAGFSRVWITLLDTHIAAFISAAFLFQFGTGPIRGFAVTLVFGLISNLFTSTFVSKALFEAVLANRRDVATLSI